MTKSNNPYFSIWFQPKETIEKVISGETNFKFYIPILLSGFSAFIDEVHSDFSLVISIVIMIFVTGLAYQVIGHFVPWIIMKTGKIWEGQSSFKNLQLVIALAQIPVLLVLVYQLVNLTLGQFVNGEQVNYLIQFTVWFFYMRILIIGIAKAQGFTYGLAIVNIVISIMPFLMLKLMLE